MMMAEFKDLKKYVLFFIFPILAVNKLQVDLLDCVQSGSQMIDDLKDVYRANAVIQ